jgi:hypothetical protein
MLAMSVRRVMNYRRDADRIRARRSLEALKVQRVAQHANEEDFDRFSFDLEQRIDPDARVTIITPDQFAAEQSRGKRNV